MGKITPVALGKRGTDTDASGVYDWAKQAYQYAACKFGTNNFTRNGTSSYGSGTMPYQDDSTTDSYQD